MLPAKKLLSQDLFCEKAVRQTSDFNMSTVESTNWPERPHTESKNRFRCALEKFLRMTEISMFWSSFCFAETTQKISHTEIPPEACALCGASILTCAAAIDVHPYWFSAQKSNSKAEIFKSAKQLRTTVLLNTKRFRTALPSRIFEQKPCEWIQRLRITPAFSRFEHRNGELLFPRKTFSKRTFKNPPVRRTLTLTVPVAWAKCLVHLSRCLINTRSARKTPIEMSKIRTFNEFFFRCSERWSLQQSITSHSWYLFLIEGISPSATRIVAELRQKVNTYRAKLPNTFCSFTDSDMFT